jgi:hypothetical protein
MVQMIMLPTTHSVVAVLAEREKGGYVTVRIMLAGMRRAAAASLLLLERCLGRCFDVVIVLFLCGYCASSSSESSCKIP